MDETTKAEIGRLRDEDNRQNRRLDLLEKNTAVVQDLALSVKELAVNMSQMLREQEKQGERLAALEQEPAKNWSNMKRTIFNTIVGAGAGAFATGIIYMMAQYVR